VDDLEVVRDAISRTFPDLITLVLTGPFGRGEGIVRKDHEGGRHTSFELEALFPRKPEARLETERMCALGSMVPKHVEVDLRSSTFRNWLAMSGVTRRGHELVHGGRFLAGDPAPYAALPRPRAAKIPPQEAERILMLAVRDLLSANALPGPMADEELARSTVNLVDAYLILLGIYTCRTREKLACIQRYGGISGTPVQLMRWALERSLDPVPSALPLPPAEAWFALRAEILKALCAATGAALRRAPLDPSELPRSIPTGRWFGLRPRSMERARARLLVLLLVSRTENGTDSSMLANAAHRMLEAGGPALTHPSWETLRDEAIVLYPGWLAGR
jgi:hypothetical protein